MYVTVTDRFSSRIEQMRMSILLKARNKDEAAKKAAYFVNPSYELVGAERWFDKDKSARQMSQLVFRLKEPSHGYATELRVAAWKK